MLKALVNELKFIFKRLCLRIISIPKNKKSFVFQVVFMMINNLFFLIFWIVIFNANGGQLNGIEFNNILYLWAIPSIAWGSCQFFFGGVFKINTYITSGRLSFFILQPKNIFLNVAMSDCNFSGLADIIYGIILGIFACGNLYEFCLILLFSFIGMIFIVCSTGLVRFTAIWFKDIESIAQIYEFNFLMNLSTNPEQIFDGFLKVLMYTVVPTMYIVHLPIRLLDAFDIKIFALILIVLGIYVFTTNLVFKLGLKKYES